MPKNKSSPKVKPYQFEYFSNKCAVCGVKIKTVIKLTDKDLKGLTTGEKEEYRRILQEYPEAKSEHYFIKTKGLTALQHGMLCQDCFKLPLEKRIKKTRKIEEDEMYYG